MAYKKRHSVVVPVVALSVLAVSSFAVPALADEASPPEVPAAEEVSTLVTEATEAAGALPATPLVDSSVDVSVPVAATDGVDVQVGDDVGFTVSTPAGISTGEGVLTDDGSTVFLGDEGQPDVAVTPVESGVRISTVLWDESGPASFVYPLPEGVDAEVQPDGGVTITRSVEVEGSAAVAEVVGEVEPAWAIDADGVAVPTTYVIADGTLTQKVDTTGAAFPVVADPTWGFTSPIQIRVRWNRAETATIAGGGWGPGPITGVCAGAGAAMAGPAGAAAFGAGCLATSGPAVYTAGVAQNSKPKRCLEGFLTYVPGVSLVIPWYGTYACR